MDDLTPVSRIVVYALDKLMIAATGGSNVIALPDSMTVGRRREAGREDEKDIIAVET